MNFYKAFDKDLCCRGIQFSIGETTSVEGEIKMCKNGIHCCKQALSCLQYYRRDTSRFCEVVPAGEMTTEGDKTVCRSITVVREIVGEELSTLLSGLYKSWWKNGQLQAECNYKDGKLNGIRIGSQTVNSGWRVPIRTVSWMAYTNPGTQTVDCRKSAPVRTASWMAYIRSGMRTVNCGTSAPTRMVRWMAYTGRGPKTVNCAKRLIYKPGNMRMVHRRRMVGRRATKPRV